MKRATYLKKYNTVQPMARKVTGVTQFILLVSDRMRSLIQPPEPVQCSSSMHSQDDTGKDRLMVLGTVFCPTAWCGFHQCSPVCIRASCLSSGERRAREETVP